MGYAPPDRRAKVFVSQPLFEPDYGRIEEGMGWADGSSVNWYQRNYPYAWVGARLVRDMP